MAYWLVKSAPDEYSLEEFERDNVVNWTGVRNHLAKKHLQAMREGESVLFYYSQMDPPAIVGFAKVEKAAYPDPTQFDSKDGHFDPTAKKEAPRWCAVDLKFAGRVTKQLGLPNIKTIKELQSMVLLKSSRLSVQPVTADEYKVIQRIVSGK